MKEGIAETLKSKSEGPEGEESQWENVNQHFEKFSEVLDQLLEFNSGFFSIVSLYVQTFSVFKLKTNLIPAISHSTLDIISQISDYFSVMKKHSEKVSSYCGDKDKLKKFLDSFSRNLCWFLGMISYKLVKVKDEKEEKKDKD